VERFRFNIDYVENRSRIKTFFAPLIILPLMLFLIFITSDTFSQITMKDHDKILTDRDQVIYSLEEKINKKGEYYNEKKQTNWLYYLNEYPENLLKGLNHYLYTNYPENIALFFISSLFIFLIWSMFVLMSFGPSSGVMMFLPVLFFIVFFKKYPSWLYTFNRGITIYAISALCYLLTLTVDFPDTEKNKVLDIKIPEPDIDNMHRLLPLIKFILLIPHLLILFLLTLLFIPLGFIGYVATCITGKYPKPIFDFIVGYLRWNFRLTCYSTLLVTDEYPQFTLSGDIDS
jgi:hypothetical protein